MTPPDTSLIVDASLAGMALLLVGAFVLLLGLRDKVNRMYVVLCDPDVGLAQAVTKIVARIERVEGRVTKLEYGAE